MLPRVPALFVALLLLVDAVCAAADAPEVTKGLASFHAPKKSAGASKTASGEKWVNSEMVAAHRTLPFGSMVAVINEKNGRRVNVRIIDRGPFKRGRIIDLSERAATELGIKKSGVEHVRVEVMQRP
ncbi:MAG: septal ring lytic transglycosylase RlpA family protein [Verrucomicrobiota bacterium]|nr:septal ring lytic transglycosylase RlpA family protein [Verrucomicrobiota bacterium]